MSRGGHTRFAKGQSGNPNGRPKARRPNISAFDIIFDKTLTVTQNGKARELTIDEALELQTYQAALQGSRMAIRKVLKMIEKREAALAKRHPNADLPPVRLEREYNADNACEAMRILGIIERDPAWGDDRSRDKVANWAAQAAISRPGQAKLDDKTVKEIRFFTIDGARLKWPRGRCA
ncbi:hypothetical protein EKN06_14660 [Croceicoccus ponticola]|uniref:DUF5681 domain-containing protein n=1 Tax=Croceicoccus ponticola TaxID=2217664 RepID=A0A437GUX0_9SPHN|nr:DUF5681 domain-containing protein [Croceicoccus ponticola]RVQ65034.1 hypothetical protein EKN06_14660 [Croceicoccus ponticola]